MALDSGLTPEEQRFFETGTLDPALQTPQPPTVDPVALAALPSQPQQPVVQQPDPVVQQPVVQQQPAVPDPSVPDMAEILRRNLAEAQARVAELEVQMRQTQKPASPDPGPDPSVDPLGALMHKLETLQTELKGMQSNMSQQTQQTQQLKAFEAFQTNVNTLKAEFARTTPDFDAAYTHLRNARIADLKAFGMTEKQINEALFREEVTLAESAINNGRNPAAVVYEMAKRHGYAAQAPAQQPQQPAAKLDAIAAAQAAAKSLPSQPAVNEVSIDNLKNASDDDLNRMVMDSKLWAKIAGSTEYPL